MELIAQANSDVVEAGAKRILCRKPPPDVIDSKTFLRGANDLEGMTEIAFRCLTLQENLAMEKNPRFVDSWKGLDKQANLLANAFLF